MDKRHTRVEQLITHQAQQTPHAVAIVSETETITYCQLNNRSNQLANGLIASGLKPGGRVCFLLPKSPEAIISIIAILKAGCTYIPLDYASPPPRLAQVLEKVECCWIIAGFEAEQILAESLLHLHQDTLPAICWITGNVPQIIKKYTGLDKSGVDAASNNSVTEPDNKANLAYIIFSSGSTGIPKGVTITHNNMLNLLGWINEQLNFTEHDKIIVFPPLHFDGSVLHVFGGLTSGAELHIVPQRLMLIPALLTEYVRKEGITQWMSVPSLFVSVISHSAVRQNDFRALKRILWGGEAFPIPYLRLWMTLLPEVEFVNSYGPTEATVACTYYVVHKIPAEDAESVPIGEAITGTELMVLNKLFQPTGTNEVGILYVSGAGLSPGYWNDEQLTRAAFTEIPAQPGKRWYCTGDLVCKDADGILHFCGRSDRQIKSRGYRIELDDIEAALNQVPGMRQSAVIATAVQGFESYHIYAAYILAKGVTLAATDIKTNLAERLPFYMLPKVWMELEVFPENSSGKTNYTEIKRLFAANKIIEINA